MSPNPLETAKKVAGEYQKKHTLELQNHALLHDVREKFQALLSDEPSQTIATQEEIRFIGVEIKILHKKTSHYPAITESLLLGKNAETAPKNARYYLDIQYKVAETKAALQPKFSVIVLLDRIRKWTDSETENAWMDIDTDDSTFQENITSIQDALGRAKDGSPGMTLISQD